MRSSRARGIALLLLSLSACHAAAPKTSDPERGVRGNGDARKDERVLSQGDELDALQAELDSAQAELSGWQQGPSLDEDVGKTAEAQPRPEPPRPVPADATPQSRCDRITALAERICGLRDAMCLLAQEHEGETRYSRACERAGLMCEEASEAADGCEDS